VSRRRRRGAKPKIFAGRNAVDPDASQAVPPPRSLPRARIERAGLAIVIYQGTLPYMGGSLGYNCHTSAVLRPVKLLVAPCVA